MSQSAAEIAPQIPDSAIYPFTTTEKILLSIGSLVAIAVMFGLCAAFGVPRDPSFNGSLLCGPVGIWSLIVVAVATAICMVSGSLIGAFVEQQAGLFCASVALAVFGVRCGPVRPVLQYAGGAGTLVVMAVECLLLGGILLAGYWFLSKVFRRVRNPQLPKIGTPALNELPNPSLPQKLGATGVQVLLTGLLELILLQSDQKAQAMAGVGIAAFAGALLAYYQFPLAESAWYWIGPVITGAIGYLLAATNTSSLPLGEVHGFFAATARAVPLDYAGTGTLGALVGFWTARRWWNDFDEESTEVAHAS